MAHNILRLMRKTVNLYVLILALFITVITICLIIAEKQRVVIVPTRNSPLIFVGGMPRSGTTLMRAMLDAHKDVRCGQETRVIPRMIESRMDWSNTEDEMARLEEAGVTESLLDHALATFILEIITNHGELAPRLCNKDPYVMRSASYVAGKLFPQSKFIFMIRDGRAVIHSLITRNVTITGYNLKDFKQCLKKWNVSIKKMLLECVATGTEKCLIVFYEQLVQHPRGEMEKVLKFLDLPWTEDVLRHEDFIGKPNGIALSDLEKSTDQVKKPIYLESLTKWVGAVPEEMLSTMPIIAPMLSVLGYDPLANPPNYDNLNSIIF